MFVIGDFLWSGLRKKIRNLGFYFLFYFFLLWIGGGVDGGCGWCCGCSLDSGIYYFIVVVILFYCDVYIILLC